MPAMMSGDAKARPMRIPASENDFEKVRSTTRLEHRRTSGIADTFVAEAKSMYASSTTRIPLTALASRPIAERLTSVPDGAFGLQRNVSAARCAASDGGMEKSEG